MRFTLYAACAYLLLACGAGVEGPRRGASPGLPAVDESLADVQVLRPRHSPDGTRIAYYARPGARRGDEHPYEGYALCVRSAAGGEEKRLGTSIYHAAFLTDPCWSPDGKFVVVSHWDIESRRGIDFETFEVATDYAGAFAKPTQGAAVHSPAAWSADGRWVALCWNLNGAAVAQVMRPDGVVRGEARLEGPESGWAAVSFDAQGERLALVGRGQLALFELAGEDGTPLRQLLALPLPGSTSEASRPPHFLGGGQQVLCCSSNRASLVEIPTQRVVPIALPGEVLDARLSPDEGLIAALVEEELPKRALEMLPGAGHASDRYARRLLGYQIATGSVRELTREAASSRRPSFVAELDLSPQALTVLSRWR